MYRRPRNKGDHKLLGAKNNNNGMLREIWKLEIRSEENCGHQNRIVRLFPGQLLRIHAKRGLSSWQQARLGSQKYPHDLDSYRPISNPECLDN